MSDYRIAPAEAVQRLPLNQQVLRALRHDIMFGLIAPGTRLTQQDLCERYNTSRMPVRDALRELEQIGVIIEENGHLIVPALTRTDLIDVYRVQGFLHGMAAERLASDQERGAVVAELHRSIDDMQTAAAQQDLRRMADLNWLFHARINETGGSRALRAAMRPVAGYTPRDWAVEFPDSVAGSHAEHSLLVDAIEDGRADDARAIAENHVVAAGNDYIEYYMRIGARIFDA